MQNAHQCEHRNEKNTYYRRASNKEIERQLSQLWDGWRFYFISERTVNTHIGREALNRKTDS